MVKYLNDKKAHPKPLTKEEDPEHRDNLKDIKVHPSHIYPEHTASLEK